MTDWQIKGNEIFSIRIQIKNITMERTNKAEGSDLLGYDAVSYGKWLPTNERNVQPRLLGLIYH